MITNDCGRREGCRRSLVWKRSQIGSWSRLGSAGLGLGQTANILKFILRPFLSLLADGPHPRLPRNHSFLGPGPSPLLFVQLLTVLQVRFIFIPTLQMRKWPLTVNKAVNKVTQLVRNRTPEPLESPGLLVVDVLVREQGLSEP